MNNNGNKFIYKIWSPIYVSSFNADYFLAARKKVFHEMTFDSQQKLLFAGVRTSADLEMINSDGLDITAIDFSKDLLHQAKKNIEIQQTSSKKWI